jgi:hypothetical protein
MNHELIIKTILDNGGKICGSYLGAWLMKGSPSDIGWQDIDIKCTEDQEAIIAKKINDIDSSIKLDFRVNYATGIMLLSPYSINLFEYDGSFKAVDEFSIFTEEWLNCIKDKICIFGKNIWQRDEDFEEILRKNNWSILDVKKKPIAPTYKQFLKIMRNK